MKIQLLPFATLPFLVSPAQADDVSLFVGPPGGIGNVEVHDETGVGSPVLPAELQGIRLLPVDCVGRTAADALLVECARLRTDVPGASRILLPNGHGSLYRYRRDGEAGAGSVFGFFVVDALGEARSLLELDGTGPLGDQDPTPDRVAVASPGDAFLVSTTLDAGGDLWSVTLDGTAVNRTSGLAPQAFDADALGLANTLGLASSANGILRFDATSAGDASFVPFPGGTPAWTGGEVVFSADGSTAATLAGPSSVQAFVYVVRKSGAAVRVSQQAVHVSSAGFLPAHTDGPHRALSPDGSVCLWRTEGASREAWIRPTFGAPQQAAAHVTADAKFADTLDTIGEFLFVTLTSVIVMVGEADTQQGGIQSGDFYLIDWSDVPSPGLYLDVDITSRLSFTNVTDTSGDTVLPFDLAGELKTEDGLYRLPGGGGALLLNSQSGGEGELLRITWNGSGVESLLSDVKSLDLIESVGSDLLLGVRRRPDDDDDIKEIYRLAGTPSSQPDRLLTIPDTLEFGIAANGPTHVGVVMSQGPAEWLLRASPATGAIELLLPFASTFGTTLGFTTSGGMALTLGTSNGPSAHGVWPLVGPPVQLPTGIVPGHVLPGR